MTHRLLRLIEKLENFKNLPLIITQIIPLSSDVFIDKRYVYELS